ncbi:MAG: FAD-dependent oxidoreductase [Dehalococcoidia bacterium]|nr:FAD-dependent oxidoreductase [Dehalococcoidia bacterium]
MTQPSQPPPPPHDEPPSLWTAAEPSRRYSSLGDGNGDGGVERTLDVAVIGGGIVGLSAALMLQDAGLDVAVIEARRVGRQVTGRSTAKVTSQHALKYASLRSTYGAEAARLYATANQSAVVAIRERAARLDADVHFEAQPAYTYATERASLDDVRQEVEAAREAGLPARFESHLDIPYEHVGAVAFDEQAQFDPYAYLEALAARVAERGAIFEDTVAADVDHGDPCRVTTHSGHTLLARHVIVATHLPFLDRGLYFARTKPRTHAVLAARVDGPRLDGMYIAADAPTRSFRSFEDERGRWLVFLGDSFTPGSRDTAALFDDLEAEARERFPITEVRYRWTNEDFDSVDGLPLVGPALPGRDRVLVATGFSAWGITNGHVAAEILVSSILGRPNPIGELFSTTRFTPLASARTTAGEVVETAKSLADRYLPGGILDLDAIEPGAASVGELNGERAAVSRDEDGTLHAVSAICTHLGCVVGWNAEMRTWDCPCHGSSFSREGDVLHGPAVHNLSHIDLDR